MSTHGGLNCKKHGPYIVNCLSCEIEGLRSKIKSDSEMYDLSSNSLVKENIRLSELNRKLANNNADYAEENCHLREALEFYADEATYFAIGFMGDAPCGPFIEDTELGGTKPGARARAALSGQKCAPVAPEDARGDAGTHVNSPAQIQSESDCTTCGALEGHNYYCPDKDYSESEQPGGDDADEGS